MISIKKLDEKAIIPTRSHINDAGADLYSIEDIIIPPSSRATIKTGISIEIPTGFYGRVAPRSGLAAKHGIDILAGVVDSTYRGEILVIMLNTDTSNSFTVNCGDRIAQLIIQYHHNYYFIESEELSSTDRGSGGFGSSGSK